MFDYFIKGKPQSFKFRFIDFSIFKNFIAGCKQLVAGKAHNLEVAGSSPAPARISPQRKMRSERIGPLPSESLVTRTVANEATNLNWCIEHSKHEMDEIV